MGVAIGSTLTGMRPIVTHQRVEFALLAIEQIINQAAKWHYMSAGIFSIPLVIRLIIGRGWGQGPQHSQSLDSWFAHIPGLKVVAPSNAFDAKGMLTAAIRDNNPVVFLEHRWLHNTTSYVPQEVYEVEIGTAKVVRTGSDITIVTYSYMVTEAISAARTLSEIGVDVEVVDLRSHRPFDFKTIFNSILKTGRLVTVDNGWIQCGIGAEVIAAVVSENVNALKSSPTRLGIGDVPIPSTRALADYVYPGEKTIVAAVADQLGIDVSPISSRLSKIQDTPNKDFTGPF